MSSHSTNPPSLRAKNQKRHSESFVFPPWAPLYYCLINQSRGPDATGGHEMPRWGPWTTSTCQFTVDTECFEHTFTRVVQKMKTVVLNQEHSTEVVYVCVVMISLFTKAIIGKICITKPTINGVTGHSHFVGWKLKSLKSIAVDSSLNHSGQEESS